MTAAPDTDPWATLAERMVTRYTWRYGDHYSEELDTGMDVAGALEDCTEGALGALHNAFWAEGYDLGCFEGVDTHVAGGDAVIVMSLPTDGSLAVAATWEPLMHVSDGVEGLRSLTAEFATVVRRVRAGGYLAGYRDAAGDAAGIVDPKGHAPAIDAVLILADHFARHPEAPRVPYTAAGRVTAARAFIAARGPGPDEFYDSDDGSVWGSEALDVFEDSYPRVTDLVERYAALLWRHQAVAA